MKSCASVLPHSAASRGEPSSFSRVLARFVIAKTVIQKARRFAKLAHGLVLNGQGQLGQRRKGTNEPYTKHLSDVARLVAESGGEGLRSAALAAVDHALR